MSNGAYAGLRLAARASNQDPDNDLNNEPYGDGDEDTKQKGKQKGKKPMDNNCQDDNAKAADQAGYARGMAEASAAANKRFSEVLASEHYAGREKLAHKMLDNFSLSASDIIGMLAEAPKSGVNASEDPEAGQRAEMQAALGQTQNSTVDPNGGNPTGKDGGKAENFTGLWDKAIASNTTFSRK